MTRSTVNMAGSVAAVAILLMGSMACSSGEPPAETTAAEPAAAQVPVPELPDTSQVEFVVPIRGEAEIGYLTPAPDRDGALVRTTITMKNLSAEAIAGLRVDEYWYDRAGNALPSDSQRVQRPVKPGEVVTVELETPWSNQMDRNSYQFSHANGTIKATLLESIE